MPRRFVERPSHGFHLNRESEDRPRTIKRLMREDQLRAQADRAHLQAALVEGSMKAPTQSVRPAEPKAGIDPIIFGEIQLLLAEKRTALSSMRTGIAVFALPLTALSVLVATSRYYEALHVLEFLIPLLILSAALVALGCYLIIQSIRRVRHYDGLIRKLKYEHSMLANLIE